MWWILWILLGLVAVYLFSELMALVGEAKVWSMLLKAETMTRDEINDVVDEMYKEIPAGKIRIKIVMFYIVVWYWLAWSD